MRYFLFLLLAFAACKSDNPLVDRYESEYETVRNRLNERAKDMDPLFDQLPAEVSTRLRESVVEIQQNDLAKFLEINAMNETDLQATLASIGGMVDRFEESRSWSLSEEQIQLYQELKAKVEENREAIERFVAKQKSSLDPQKMSMAILFEKVLTMDAQTFKENSMVGSNEFTISMRESLDQWDIIFMAVLMSDMDGVIKN